MSEDGVTLAPAIGRPTVTESLPQLEPVVPDPFIDDLDDAGSTSRSRDGGDAARGQGS
jgi:hypothetical protein